MVARVLRFVRLPLLLLVLFTVIRFTLGATGTPYAPRGNAMFSIIGLTFISCFYFGALSRRIGGFTWGGTLLVGFTIGLAAQILIFTATWLSFAAGIENSYFRHWDALNLPPDTVATMSEAMMIRLPALVVGPLIGLVPTLIGGAAASLAPDKSA